MFRLLFGLTLGVILSCASAFAKTPPEVLEPYKAYKAALKAQDVGKAAKAARLAWDMAEEKMGDSPTTAALAQNFAFISKKDDGKSKDIIRAYERAIELSPLEAEDPVSLRLEREVLLGTYLVKIRKGGAFKRRFKEAVQFAEDNGVKYSVFLGELYTLRSEVDAGSQNHKSIEKYADLALEHFEKADAKYATFYPYKAHLYAGYGKEGQDKLIPAAMSYQVVMQNLEGQLPRNHPFMMRALGRWMTMRGQIVRAGLKDEAEQAGMCECWPYDKKRNEAVQPIKRVPPVMPSNAWQSGFSIVEFDLDDEGNTINQKLLESWPEKVWDKSSIRSVKRWKYSPKTAAEKPSDRTGIITTIRYQLAGPNGKLIE